MTMRILAAAAAALLAAAPATAQRIGSPSPVPRLQGPAPATAVDWTRHVERTAEGGYLMGNPDARVKLVEYGSVTCPHCAHFAAEADQALRGNYIRSGRVSFEYRPYLIFPSDPGIFLLLACQEPDRFFDTVDRLYATQPAWTAKIQAQESQLNSLGWPAMLPAVVRASGVDDMFRQGGLSRQRVDACLADQAGFQRLIEAQQRAERLGVQGTPTFFINGRKLEVGDWAGLEPLLRGP